MKKLIILAVLLAFASNGFAAMDDRTFRVAVDGASTNAVTYVLRGELEAVHIDVPTASTGTVTVATSEGTVFTKADASTTAVYYPRLTVHTNDGSANTNVFTKPPMAGPVEVKVVGTGTNAVVYTVKLIYKK